MSENKIQKQASQNMADDQVAGRTLQPARRRLLKGTVAIPIIMTLHSGAALARTSNLVGPANIEDAVTVDSSSGQRIVCIQPGVGGGPLEEGGSTYDLGEGPTMIYGDPEDTLDIQVGKCQQGGGILISSAAFTSIVDILGEGGS